MITTIVMSQHINLINVETQTGRGQLNNAFLSHTIPQGRSNTFIGNWNSSDIFIHIDCISSRIIHNFDTIYAKQTHRTLVREVRQAAGIVRKYQWQCITMNNNGLTTKLATNKSKTCIRWKTTMKPGFMIFFFQKPGEKLPEFIAHQLSISTSHRLILLLQRCMFHDALAVANSNKKDDVTCPKASRTTVPEEVVMNMKHSLLFEWDVDVTKSMAKAAGSCSTIIHFLKKNVFFKSSSQIFWAC